LPGSSVDRCEHKEGQKEDVEEEEKEELKKTVSLIEVAG